jgi:hypothetical protein
MIGPLVFLWMTIGAMVFIWLVYHNDSSTPYWLALFVVVYFGIPILLLPR